MVSYSKSGNIEDLWEDLIFMNFMMHFKQLIKGNGDAVSKEYVNWEYGVHLPSVGCIVLLVEKCIEVHFKNIDNKNKEADGPKTPMKDTIAVCCLNLLFKVTFHAIPILKSDPEKYEDDKITLIKSLTKFILNSPFFHTSKTDSNDMKYPIKDPNEFE